MPPAMQCMCMHCSKRSRLYKDIVNSKRNLGTRHDTHSQCVDAGFTDRNH